MSKKAPYVILHAVLLVSFFYLATVTLHAGLTRVNQVWEQANTPLDQDIPTTGGDQDHSGNSENNTIDEDDVLIFERWSMLLMTDPSNPTGLQREIFFREFPREITTPPPRV